MNRKFISALSGGDIELLTDALEKYNSKEEVLRVRAVFMSHERFTVKEIAIKLGVTRDTVSGWIDVWDEKGIEGLRSRKRSGRPPVLDTAQEGLLEKLILANPDKVNSIKFDFEFETGKKISISTVKRFKARLKVRHDQNPS